MKKLLLGIVLLTLVLAFHSHAYADNRFSRETCDNFGELAGVIMMLRQKNIPMSEVIQIGSEVTQAGEQQTALERMVIAAYDRPLMSSDKYRTRTINEFRNDWLTTCYKIRNEEGEG